MSRRLRNTARTLAAGAFLGVVLQAQSASLTAGSGASPPASATGIYEIARITTDTGKVQRALALVHKGSLKEVHSRSSTRYQKRASGSTPVRVTTDTYDKLVTKSGGTNRDVNTLPMETRCQYYQLAGIPTTGMNCPTSSTLPPTTSPTASGTCPTGYELKISFVNGRKQVTCALMTGVPRLPEVPERWAGVPGLPVGSDVGGWLGRLSPIPAAEARLMELTFKSALFFNPIEFMYEPAGTGMTEYGGWRFSGFGLTILWFNDGP
jgi:hypothetical protein